MSNPEGAGERFGRLLRDNGLTLALVGLFALSLMGHWVFGWLAALEQLQQHAQRPIGLLTYALDPRLLSTVFENWESEFLQMGVYVALTAMLVQRGSSESRDPDAGPRDKLPSRDPTAPRLARMTGPVGWAYSHSLGLVMAALFLASFILHWLFSAEAAAQEAAEHGQTARSTLAYLGDPQLWFESFQNWQSEFLSTAALVVFSIFLRHKNSPESKAVAAPHSQTGSD